MKKRISAVILTFILFLVPTVYASSFAEELEAKGYDWIPGDEA